MLRDKSLVPLSRQHQHALALCVRIDRSSPIAAGDVEMWQNEISRHFETEIRIHFAAEEQVLFPAIDPSAALAPVVEELRQEHAVLRDYFSRAEAQRLEAAEISAFAERLSAHIRREERQFFEALQECMSPEELAALGLRLEESLIAASQSCALSGRDSKPVR
jgi:hemerythrin-like domain-containing protein